MGIKSVINKAAGKIGDGIAATGGLSPMQVKKIEAQRSKYLGETPNPQNMEAIYRNLGAVGVEVYQAYLEQIKNIYKPISSDTSFSAVQRIRYFDITKWVTDKEESSFEKLINVYHVLSQEQCNIALIYHRSTAGCRVSMGVVNTDFDQSVPAVANNYYQRIVDALRGNFPGTEITNNPKAGVPDVLDRITDKKHPHSVAIVSNLASDKSEKFISQSMEKLLDGVVPGKPNEEYTIVLLATPVVNQLEKMNRLFTLYSALMPYSSWQTNYTNMNTTGVNAAANAGVNAGVNVGVNFGVAIGANLGASFSRSSGEAVMTGNTDGITQNCSNFAVQHTLENITKQVKRLEEGSALGMWDFAAYIISESYAVANNVSHMYLALTQGEESYMTRSSVNLWDGQGDDAVEILKSVQRLCHPEFVLRDNVPKEWLVYPAWITPSTLLSGKELAKALNFPRKSVTGLPVIECAEFGRNISTYDKAESGESIHLGKIFHMNRSEDTKVALNKNSLTAHTFITGSTKAGKSNTVYQILNTARASGVKFLVVEPAKGEYKNVFGNDKDVYVYGTNKAKTPLLRIDPFSFPKDVHVLEHLDRLVEIFNVCWPMYAAMPAVLKNAIEKSYEDCGWNLTESTNKFGQDLYPIFSDVARNVKKIIDSSEYDTDNKGAYKGSLLTRLNSLTNGINGLIFQSDEISANELFYRNVIVDLSRVGSMETKSLIMGMLVLKLQEYRMSGANKMNAELKHLTVLEEAHHLLKRTSTEQPTEGGNLLGKSVEMLSNAIAEMRTYGEGFIIADQAPGLLDMSVIRNTNTKIILRLPDLSDRELVGKTANLNENQIAELAKLPCGVAAVYQNEWIQPVLCKVDEFKSSEKPYVLREDNSTKKPKVDLKKRLKLVEILNNKTGRNSNTNEIKQLLNDIEAASSVRVKILRFLDGDSRIKRAEVISVLYPEVTRAVRDAYSSSRDTTTWTEAAKSALCDVTDNKLRDLIVQSVIVAYTCNELGDVNEFNRWKEGMKI